MSNLQVLARRCPVMGKAMAVQSAKANNAMLGGVYGGVRAYNSRAKLHTTRAREAQAVDVDVLRHAPGTSTSTWSRHPNSYKVPPPLCIN